MRTFLILASLLASSACLRTTEYRCSDDPSCGPGGVCETTGYCSFIDSNCTSGRSYSASAGSLSGNCTSGDAPIIDASNGSDDSMQQQVDGAMPDTPVAQCPSGYAAISGGETGHLYKVITTTASWSTQEAACQLTTTKAHLAAPGDITELTALDTLAGAVATYWIGVSDIATEMTWVNTFGTAQTYLPWMTGAPNDANPGEDCVESFPSLHQWNDQRCNTSLTAICECTP